MWPLLAVGDLIASSIKTQVNSHYQVDPWALNMWRALISSLILFPIVAFFVPWPSDANFYLIAVLGGIEATISTTVIFKVSREINGRVAALKTPVIVFATYLAWLLVTPSEHAGFSFSSLEDIAILTSLFVAGLSFLFLVRCPFSYKALLMMIPAIILNVTLTILLRNNVEHSTQLLGDMLCFYLIILSLQAFFCALYLKYKKQHSLFKIAYPKKYITPVLTTAICGVLGILGWIATIEAPNPAYARAIAMLSPVLLLAYHRARKIEDPASVWPSIWLTASVISLTLLAV